MRVAALAGVITARNILLVVFKTISSQFSTPSVSSIPSSWLLLALSTGVTMYAWAAALLAVGDAVVDEGLGVEEAD